MLLRGVGPPAAPRRWRRAAGRSCWARAVGGCVVGDHPEECFPSSVRRRPAGGGRNRFALTTRKPRAGAARPATQRPGAKSGDPVWWVKWGMERGRRLEARRAGRKKRGRSPVDRLSIESDQQGATTTTAKRRQRPQLTTSEEGRGRRKAATSERGRTSRNPSGAFNLLPAKLKSPPPA